MLPTYGLLLALHSISTIMHNPVTGSGWTNRSRLSELQMIQNIVANGQNWLQLLRLGLQGQWPEAFNHAGFKLHPH